VNKPLTEIILVVQPKIMRYLNDLGDEQRDDAMAGARMHLKNF
jgi:hypothetical protein